MAEKTYPSSPKTSISEEEYYQKADNLVRSSAYALQSVFKSRWKQKTGVEWASACANQFIDDIGQTVHKNAKPLQKRMLQYGNLEEWDVSLLAQVLNCLKNAGSSKKKRNKENEAIQSLVGVRNQLAHNGLKKLSQAEYDDIDSKFRESVTVLVVLFKNDIDKIIENAGITSSVAAFEQERKIREKADVEAKNRKYKEAIKLCENGLEVPSLLKTHQGTFYELMAECYLMIRNPQKVRNV